MTRKILLVLDFDETLTAGDTISLLASTAYRLRPANLPALPPWHHFTSAYLADFSRLPCVEKEQRRTATAEFEYLHGLRPVETASLDRIEAAGVFKGLHLPSLEEAAGKHVVLKEHAGELVRSGGGTAGNAAKADITVISVNWSTAWIRGAIAQSRTESGSAQRSAQPQVDIFSNELEIGDDGLTTGRIIRRVVTADDKVRALKAIREKGQDGGVEQKGRAGDEKDGRETIVVYVGDSSTDLMCLLDADVGVVVGDKLDGVCERIGIDMVDLPEKAQRGKALWKVKVLAEVVLWVRSIRDA